MILIVKGGHEAALESATSHGIEATLISHNDSEAHLKCVDSEWRKVASWYNSDLGRKAPYAVGALLHYSYGEAPLCTCKFVGAGEPMDNKGCAVHTQNHYPCDGRWGAGGHVHCQCTNYRPTRQPGNQNQGGWPACVCGHAATSHN